MPKSKSAAIRMRQDLSLVVSRETHAPKTEPPYSFSTPLWITFLTQQNARRTLEFRVARAYNLGITEICFSFLYLKMAEKKPNSSDGIQIKNSKVTSGRDIVGGDVNYYGAPPPDKSHFWIGLTCAVTIIVGLIGAAATIAQPFIACWLSVNCFSTPTIVPSIPTPTTIDFPVHVTDKKTGRPISNAELNLDYGSAHFSLHSAGNGYCTFQFAPTTVTNATLTTRASGYATDSVTITFPLPDTIREIQLVPSGTTP